MTPDRYTAHIDWYQFTVKFTELDARAAYELNAYDTVNQSLTRVLGKELCNVLFQKHVGSGSGYEYRYKNKEKFEGGAALYHGGHEHCLVVLAGTCCQRLVVEHEGILEAIMELTGDMCSRIDLAATLWATESVDEFVGSAGSDMARFPSQTGITYYAGSRKSDAFTRIYRFNEPHPRSDTIRVEHEFKGKAAKACVKSVLHSGIEGIIKTRGTKKGLNMDFMKQDAVKLVVGENRPKSAERTIYWLSTSVKSACQRLIDEGSLTPDELFDLLIAPTFKKDGS